MKFSYLPLALLALSTFLSLSVNAQVKDAFTKKSLPAIEIQTLEGKKVNIADYGENGKITIINFWATWCGPCITELTNIANLYPYWQEDYDAELVAISLDDSRSTAKVKSFVNGRAWDYIVLQDPNQQLQRAFNFQSPPFTLVVDQNGEIVYTHSSYRAGDEYALEDKLAELSE